MIGDPRRAERDSTEPIVDGSANAGAGWPTVTIGVRAERSATTPPMTSVASAMIAAPSSINRRRLRASLEILSGDADLPTFILAPILAPAARQHPVVSPCQISFDCRHASSVLL